MHNLQHLEAPPIKLDPYAARSVIIALANVLKFHPKKEFPRNLYFSIGNTILALEKTRHNSKFQRGNMLVKCKNTFKGEPIYLAEAYGNDKIQKHVERVTGSVAREMQLAKLMRKKTVTMASFTPDDFNADLKINLGNESSLNLSKCTDKNLAWLEYYIHFLNKLNFLRSIFEVVRRLYRDKANGQVYAYETPFAKRSDELPIGCAQARTSILLQQGAIKCQDVFGNSTISTPMRLTLSNKAQLEYLYNATEDRAIYGTVTGITSSEHSNIREQKIALIEEKIKLTNAKFFAHSNKNSPGKRKIDDHTTSTRSMYTEMCEEYGSGNESSSSDSDYSSDEDANKKPKNKL